VQLIAGIGEGGCKGLGVGRRMASGRSVEKLSRRQRHRCSGSCGASASQDRKFGFAGPRSEKPRADFKQGHDINGFLVSEGHSGCLGETCVRV